MDEKEPGKNCVLGFTTLLLKQEAAYDEIIAMLTRDRNSDQVWIQKKERELNVRGWIVYELLHQIVKLTARHSSLTRVRACP